MSGVSGEVGDTAEFLDMYEDALLEVGNVVLNACLSSVSNFLGLDFESDVPSILRGACEKIMSQDGALGPEQPVLYVQIEFIIADEGLNGHIGLCLNMQAMDSLESYLDRYLDGQLGS
jgi:chemotaxis protein CheC